MGTCGSYIKGKKKEAAFLNGILDQNIENTKREDDELNAVKLRALDPDEYKEWSWHDLEIQSKIIEFDDTHIICFAQFYTSYYKFKIKPIGVDHELTQPLKDVIKEFRRNNRIFKLKLHGEHHTGALSGEFVTINATPSLNDLLMQKIRELYPDGQSDVSEKEEIETPPENEEHIEKNNDEKEIEKESL